MLNKQGLRSIKFVEIDGLYPALLLPLDDPTLMMTNAVPFKQPTPFGVEPQQWLRALLLCPRHPLPKCSRRPPKGTNTSKFSSTWGTNNLPCVVYGSGTPGALSEWSLQVCASHLLDKPKGRNNAIFGGVVLWHKGAPRSFLGLWPRRSIHMRQIYIHIYVVNKYIHTYIHTYIHIYIKSK